jgi:hypothetical protein
MMTAAAAAITMHNHANVQISSSTLSLIANFLDSGDTKVEGLHFARDVGHTRMWPAVAGQNSEVGFSSGALPSPTKISDQRLNPSFTTFCSYR